MENQFKAIFERLPNAIILIDVDEGEVYEVNSSALTLLSYPRRELVGSKTGEVFTNDSFLKEFLESAEKDSEAQEYVTELISKDNSTIYAKLVLSVLDLEDKKIVQVMILSGKSDEAKPSRKPKAELNYGFSQREGSRAASVARSIKDSIEDRVGVFCNGFVMAAALRELLDKTKINVKYYTYPDEFELEADSLQNVDFLIFASPRVSKVELNDLLDLCRDRINLPILIVCLNVSNDRIITLIKAGIRGVITNENEFHLIPVAIKAIRNNELWCPRSILQQVFEHYKKGIALSGKRKEIHQMLSSREIEILTFIVKGFKNRDIANELSISYSTVINHTYNIYRKLEVNNRAGAIRFAINNRLVENAD